MAQSGSDPAIEIALTPDPRWQVDAATLAAAASRVGFTSVGIGAQQGVDGVGAALRESGLRCLELQALLVTRDDDRTLADAKRLAGEAASIGAEWVSVVNRVPLTPQSAPVLAECAAMFADAGAGFAYEFTPGGAAESIAEGLAFLDAVAPAKAGLLIDTWHFFNGTSTWEQLETVPLEQIAFVQFTDGFPLTGTGIFDETFNRRAWPGQGSFDLSRFAHTLRDRGWHGTVTVEVLSAELHALPLDDFAARAYESTARFWR